MRVWIKYNEFDSKLFVALFHFATCGMESFSIVKLFSDRAYQRI